MWTVDECPDANGHWTIRLDDGTVNGDVLSPAIATVYNFTDAIHICASHNVVLDIQEQYRSKYAKD